MSLIKPEPVCSPIKQYLLNSSLTPDTERGGGGGGDGGLRRVAKNWNEWHTSSSYPLTRDLLQEIGDVCVHSVLQQNLILSCTSTVYQQCTLLYNVRELAEGMIQEKFKIKYFEPLPL